MTDLLMTGLNAYTPHAYKVTTEEERTIRREAFTAGMEYASSLTADDYFAAFVKLKADFERLRDGSIAMLSYVEHAKDCDFGKREPGDPRCACGLSELLVGKQP